MMNIRVLAVSALCLGSLPIFGVAHAATAFIDGNIYWGSGTAATEYSQAGEISNFSFDVDNPPSSNPTHVTNFQYTLDNVAVRDTRSYVQFYPAAQNGLFDIVFADTTVSLFGADIGSNGTIGPSNFYAATAGINDYFPGTGIGSVAVSTGPLSAVPLPAALPLLGTAIAGLGLIARRRKTASQLI